VIDQRAEFPPCELSIMRPSLRLKKNMCPTLPSTVRTDAALPFVYSRPVLEDAIAGADVRERENTDRRGTDCNAAHGVFSEG
jgi:hypothetical protein